MTAIARMHPAELARRLGLPEPTPEQAAVIAGEPEPTVVVAGAGSGKSETMAARVVWLVACGYVRPEHVLGLTFTRKAAAELAARVRCRLDQLRRTGLVPEPGYAGEPTVSTYHAYAARLVADHAAREAYEPSTRLITPAVQWQLAARVVAAYDGPMDAIEWSPATVIAAVLELAGELSEHLVTARHVRDVGRRLRAEAAALPGRVPAAVRDMLRCQDAREQLLPLVEGYRREKARHEVMDYDDQVALAARIASRHPDVAAIERSRYTVVLLDEYQDTSHSQLVLLRALFGDGHAVTAVGDPCQSIYGWRGASAGNLRRFPRDFPAHRGNGRPGAPAHELQLSVSFRNGERILAVAEALATELRAEGARVPRLRPGPGLADRGNVLCALFETVRQEADWIASRIAGLLAAGDAADAASGGPPDPVRGAGDDPETAAGPAKRRRQVEAVRPADVAILARKRAQLPGLRRALEDRGIPVEVVGLGGLLSVPEVQDVVATLRVLHDPDAGDALVRLLTGPRWRIGPRDIVALGRRARELAAPRRDLAVPNEAPDEAADEAASEAAGGTAGGAAERAEAGDAADRGAAAGAALARLLGDLGEQPGASLVDALDDLGPADSYSPAGYARLRALADELRTLRTRVGLPLADLVTEVERALGLDIEVAARPARPGGTADPVAARADLDAFLDVAAYFADESEGPTLGAFLAYLRAADDQEFGLETGRVGETDSVKLLTVHAAKGLEWPVVVVPGLAAGDGASVFPASPRVSSRWTDNPRRLPFPLRGDQEDLPSLAGLDGRSREEFAAACRRRDELEERRLAYVAATRAASSLWCTGYWWGGGKRPLGPSVFLEEVRAACEAGAGEVVCWAPPPPEDALNPMLNEDTVAYWPAEVAGPRQAAVRDGARMVAEALRQAGPGGACTARTGDHDTGDPEPEPGSEYGPGEMEDVEGGSGSSGTLDEDQRRRAASWARDGRLLVAERAARARTGPAPVELPARLAVTDLVTLAEDPALLARRIRRPMPRPPAPHARRGTAFHRWLEARYGQQRLLEDDDLPGAADAGHADANLDELQRRFLAGDWGDRVPVDVEVPFEMVVGDRLVRGRMDAVFRDPDGGYCVVDWKTGGRPSGPEADAAAVQLAAYRLAWADLAGVPLDRVRAAFHYIRSNETVHPVDLYDAAALAALIDTVPEAP